MKKHLLIKQIHASVSDANNILLLTHENPDIDAICSVYAFSHYLEFLNKKHVNYFRNLPPGLYANILSGRKHTTDAESIEKENFELIIIFDSGDFSHTGIEKSLKTRGAGTKIFNIDHHPTNIFFGKINLVETEAVSTTEILYEYLSTIPVPLTREVSEYLLAGILGDTNNFTNHNTTPRSIEIASHLISRGAQIEKLFRAIQYKKSSRTIHVWGKIFERLKINKQYNIAVTVVSKQDFEEFENNPEIFTGISNYLNNIGSVKLSMVIKETPENILRVSMRSNDDLIDLSKFVKIFNGGGHKKAAGFSIRGNLAKTHEGWRIV